jgi:hypothetical protein
LTWLQQFEKCYPDHSLNCFYQQLWCDTAERFTNSWFPHLNKLSMPGYHHHKSFLPDMAGVNYCNLFHSLGDFLFKIYEALVASTVTDALKALQNSDKARCLIPRCCRSTRADRSAYATSQQCAKQRPCSTHLVCCSRLRQNAAYLQHARRQLGTLSGIWADIREPSPSAFDIGPLPRRSFGRYALAIPALCTPKSGSW